MSTSAEVESKPHFQLPDSLSHTTSNTHFHTPLTAQVSNTRHSDFIFNNINLKPLKGMLVDELKGASFSMKHLPDKLFPDNLLSLAVNNEIFNIELTDQWSEKAVTEYFNHIGELLAQRVGVTLDHHWVTSQCNKPTKGSSIKHKPDLGLVNINQPTVPHWVPIYAIAEVTAMKQCTHIRSTLWQKALVHFKAQPY